MEHELTRFEIINDLIKKNKFKSFLEIGTQQSISGKNIECKLKVGVDPSPMTRAEGDYDEFYQTTSDYFYVKDNRKWDLQFIDGDHSFGQSLTDFTNAVSRASKNGIVVLHDCLPRSEEYTSTAWCGEVYKTISIVHNSGFDYFIVDSDNGVGVVYVHNINRPMKKVNVEELNYSRYLKEKKKWEIVSPAQFLKK